MNTTIKVALACFIGSALGIFTMLNLNPKLWSVGLLVGGLAGYLSYEFKKVLQAVPLAWRYTTSWRPDREWWRLYFRAIPACFFSGTTAGIGLALFVLGCTLGTPMIVAKLHFFFGSLLLGGVLLALLGPVAILSNSRGSREKYEEKLHSTWNENPVRVFLWLPLFAAWWLIRHIPDAIAIGLGSVQVALECLRDFFWSLFKLIHSEERLLCGVDAAIGVAVCHYSDNNVFLGIGVGILWGVFNFEILSIRVLKLVPATASIFHRS